MIETLAERRSPQIDIEVTQRLLKALDFIVLGLSTLTITLAIARLVPQRDNDALVGLARAAQHAHHAQPRSLRDHLPFLREHRVDLIIVAIRLSAQAPLPQILKKALGTPCRHPNQWPGFQAQIEPARLYAARNAAAARGLRPTGWGSFLKSTMDRCLAGALIVLLSPFLALTALAVRLDSKGPISFKERCYGFNNELIEVYKFRSMHADLSDPSTTRR
jgi:Bacterial sugar transferase